MPTRRPCLLFDLDGTICDTDPVHIQAFNRVLAHLGVNFGHEDYATRVLGRTNQTVFAEILPHLPVDEHERLSDRKEALFREMATALVPQDGLLDILDWAEGYGMGTALVTNAPRANADMVLAALGLAKRFDVVVIAHDLPRQKPDPLPYQEGLRLLGGHPARSVAFEDSRSGITAAVAAGLPTIGLTSTLSGDALLQAGATLAVKDFRDPRVVDLVADVTGVG
jgi:beta-phosphoglucomutase